MGCFFGCFGFKKKKKSKRIGKKRQSAEQNRGSYVPLDSDVSIVLDIKENVASDSYHLKEKPKMPTISKIKKKVSFNLNVKTYEPIPNDNDSIAYLSEGEEKTKWEFDTETKSIAFLHHDEDSSNSTAANYRYKDCRDSYDDDELGFDESYLNFEESEDSDQEPDDVFSKECDDVGSDNEIITNRTLEEENRSLEGLKAKSHARDRSQYVFSVLNPIENLSQWRKVKDETRKTKFQQEDLNSKVNTRNLNVSRFSESTIQVDASFSNWNMRDI